MPWCKKLLKPMSAILTINKIKFILIIIALFAISYLLNVNMAVAMLLCAILAYLFFSKKHLLVKNYSLLNLGFLYTILFVAAYALVKNNISVFWLPFCVMPMLAVLLFNELRIALLFTIIAALTVAAVAGNSLNVGFLYLISGIVSCVFVFEARKRSVIIRSGLLIGLFQALILICEFGFQINLFHDYIVLLISGFSCGIIVAALRGFFRVDFLVEIRWG